MKDHPLQRGRHLSKGLFIIPHEVVSHCSPIYQPFRTERGLISDHHPLARGYLVVLEHK